MQFDRVINLKIRLINETRTAYEEEIDIQRLRMAFSINKTQAFTTNSANVRIWNLGPTNRNRIRNIGDQIRLFAGYALESGPQLLFIGNTTQSMHIFEQPEIITVLDAGDGEIELNNLIVSVSFGERVAARTVIQSIADRMGLTIVDFAQTDNLYYENGFSSTGRAAFVLQKACGKLNLFFSVQNNNLVILGIKGSSSKPPYEINENTGMIGIPQRYIDKKQYLYAQRPKPGDLVQSPLIQPGWKVRTLLKPQILPGDRIRLRSTKVDINGLFYVQSIRHEGDTYGPIFESQLEVYPVIA